MITTRAISRDCYIILSLLHDCWRIKISVKLSTSNDITLQEERAMDTRKFSLNQRGLWITGHQKQQTKHLHPAGTYAELD